MFPDAPVSPWEIAIVCSFILPFMCGMLWLYRPLTEKEKEVMKYIRR